MALRAAAGMICWHFSGKIRRAWRQGGGRMRRSTVKERKHRKGGSTAKVKTTQKAADDARLISKRSPALVITVL